MQSWGLFASRPAGKDLPVLKIYLVTGIARVGLFVNFFTHTHPPRAVAVRPGSTVSSANRDLSPVRGNRKPKAPGGAQRPFQRECNPAAERTARLPRAEPSRAALPAVPRTPSPAARRSRAFFPAAPEAFGPQELADFAPGEALGSNDGNRPAGPPRSSPLASLDSPPHRDFNRLRLGPRPGSPAPASLGARGRGERLESRGRSGAPH